MKVISRAEAKRRGLSVYFTGKPCKHGHLSERYLSGACRECAVKASLARETALKADPNLLRKFLDQRLRQHAHRMTNSEFVERKRETDRRTDAKRQGDPIKRAKRNARIVARRRDDPAKLANHRQASLVWQKNNPIAVSTRRHKRRARTRNAEGSFTSADITLMLVAQGGHCFWCDADIDNYKKRHVDHYIPLARGGTNWSNNIVLACATCNLQKRDKLPDEFLAYRAAL